MRNLDCPLYRLCLDEACDRMAADWHCDQCRWKGSRAIPEIMEFTGYHILAIAVLFPDVYAEYLRKMQRKRFEIISSVFSSRGHYDLPLVQQPGTL